MFLNKQLKQIKIVFASLLALILKLRKLKVQSMVHRSICSVTLFKFTSVQLVSVVVSYCALIDAAQD